MVENTLLLPDGRDNAGAFVIPDGSRSAALIFQAIAGGDETTIRIRGLTPGAGLPRPR